MQQYHFAEYAINGVKNRNKIQSIEEFQIGENNIDCYRSIFLFNDDLRYYVEKFKSVSGFSGKHITDELVFDFDGQDLSTVKEEVIKFCYYLHYTFELPVNFLRISFSGNKGFHVTIPFNCFSLEPQPKDNFYQIYKSVAEDLASDFKFIDKKIYEQRRLIRITNTIHSVSSLYKIPLLFDELQDLTVEGIKELAKQRRLIELYPVDECTEIESLKEIYSKWNRHNYSRIKLLNQENNLISFLTGVEEGERNTAAIRLTGYFISKNIDESMAIELLNLWNKKNNPPLEDHELRQLCRDAFKKYNPKPLDKLDVYDLRRAKEIYMKHLSDLQQNRVTTGFSKVDNKLRGIVPGETCCIIGRTEVGKSAFLQNIGLNYAKLSKAPVLFFSMEMPITSVYERTIQIETNLSGQDVEQLLLTNNPDFNTRTDLVTTTIPNFFTIEKGNLTIDQIKKWITFCEENIYNQSTGLILIDYLGLVKGEGTEIYQQVSKVARGMKDLAKDLKVPVIFLSQVNKSYSDETPLELGAARDSGVIDEASDFVLGLWKAKENHQIDDPTKKRLVLGLLKNRKGGKGNINISMDKISLKMMEDSL